MAGVDDVRGDLHRLQLLLLHLARIRALQQELGVEPYGGVHAVVSAGWELGDAGAGVLLDFQGNYDVSCSL